MESMIDIVRVVYDLSTRTYYSVRPDDPARPLKKITLGAISDLLKNMLRYEEDGTKNPVLETGRR